MKTTTTLIWIPVTYTLFLILIGMCVVLVIGCDNDTSLHQICGNFHEKCYAVWTDEYKDPQLDSSYQANRFFNQAKDGLVGTCKMGKPTCDEDMNIVNCEGAVYPHYEDVCNGLDEDCNGEIDDGSYPIKPKWWRYTEPNPCPSEYGVCSKATISCDKGKFVCNLPDDYEVVEVTCDGKDNDCDARFDNIDPRGFCFDGDFWQATQGNCKPGLTLCLHEQWQCIGQISPTEELCDGIDNDCNGITDDTSKLLTTKYDIVFVIDTSGSMCRYIASVAMALNAYVRQFENNPNFRFAIVLISSLPGDLVRVDRDFTDLGTITNRILTLGCTGWALEASLDSMDMVCDETNPLQLSWKDGANRLQFVFTDEEPQTYTTIPTTTQDVINSCIASNTVPFIWSNNEQGFVDIVNNTGGIAFIMVDNWITILDNLNDIVIQLCGI